MSSSTSSIKLKLLWDNGKKCAICGREIKKFDQLTVDHIIPLSKGGKNEIKNCQLAHKDCNAAKRDIMPDVFDEIIKHSKYHIFRNRFFRIILTR